MIARVVIEMHICAGKNKMYTRSNIEGVQDMIRPAMLRLEIPIEPESPFMQRIGKLPNYKFSSQAGLEVEMAFHPPIEKKVKNDNEQRVVSLWAEPGH